MKNLLLTLFTVVLSTSYAYSNNTPIATDGPPVPAFSETHGLGAPATPIDNYTLILFLLGFLIASSLYFYNKNLLVKTK